MVISEVRLLSALKQIMLYGVKHNAPTALYSLGKSIYPPWKTLEILCLSSGDTLPNVLG